MSRDDNDNFTFNFDNLEPPDDSNNSDETIPLDVWVPDRAIKAIEMEAQLYPDETQEQLAQRILKENLALIAMGITQVSLQKNKNLINIRIKSSDYHPRPPCGNLRQGARF